MNEASYFNFNDCLMAMADETRRHILILLQERDISLTETQILICLGRKMRPDEKSLPTFVESIRLSKTLPCLAEPGKLIVIGKPNRLLDEVLPAAPAPSPDLPPAAPGSSFQLPFNHSIAPTGKFHP